MPGDVFSSTHPAQEAREDKVSVGETGGGSFSGGKEGENKYVSVCKDVCLESFFFSAFVSSILVFWYIRAVEARGGSCPFNWTLLFPFSDVSSLGLVRRLGGM